MSEEKGLGVTDFFGLAKVFPLEKIYDDLLSRGVKQAGGLIEDFCQTIRLALPTVQLAAADQRRFREIIEKPYFRIPAEYRVLPPKQLAAKILEGIRYEPDGTEIYKMFEELLERGCDSSRISQAHPAFAGLIPQLSHDEAVLLKELNSANITMLSGMMKNFNDYIDVPKNEIGSELRYLNYPENALIYANHLEALGLIDDLVGTQSDNIVGGFYDGYVRLYWTLQLSKFGSMFSDAVFKKNESSPT